MKKYTITLLLLIASGLVLAYFTIKQSLEIDQEVYLETSKSVRHLKVLDNSLNLLLFRIRYEDNNSYDSLEELSISISDEFDNLRFEALFEEIESSDALNNATIEFGDRLANKQEHIEQFIEHHRALSSAYKSFRSYSRTNSSFENEIQNLELGKTIDTLNINFYRFLQNNNQANKLKLNNSIAAVDNVTSALAEDERESVDDYIRVLSEIILESAEIHSYFTQALEQATAERLNTLESAYADFHNQQIHKSNDLRNILIIYGLVLLVLLIIFAYQLRKQYLSLEQQVADRTEEIEQAYNELKESQEQLIQSEKMASLGEMVAGVAHEINTPLGYVNSNVDTINLNMQDIGGMMQQLHLLYKEAASSNRDNKKLSSLLSATLKAYQQLHSDEILKESEQLLDDSSHGLNEISHLVTSLKDFARLDRQATDEIDIHDCIESSIKIASNHIRENTVNVERLYETLPNIVCTPSKLNQLFLNIITNASQAMKENGGSLTIRTQLKGESIIVAFTDQGIGMDEETSQKMFDPFFTSKPIGEGTGLGMSIAYKIVQAHKGKIQVKSKPDHGTTIAVQLPINPSDA